MNRFAPGFFELGNKQAGHCFQKMQNYQVRLVIFGDISAHVSLSKAGADFVGKINRIWLTIRPFFQAERSARMAGKFGVSMTDPPILHALPQLQPDVGKAPYQGDAAPPQGSSETHSRHSNVMQRW